MTGMKFAYPLYHGRSVQKGFQNNFWSLSPDLRKCLSWRHFSSPTPRRFRVIFNTKSLQNMAFNIFLEMQITMFIGRGKVSTSVVYPGKFHDHPQFCVLSLAASNLVSFSTRPIRVQWGLNLLAKINILFGISFSSHVHNENWLYFAGGSQHPQGIWTS